MSLTVYGGATMVRPVAMLEAFLRLYL
jgi:hypothetical protein